MPLKLFYPVSEIEVGSRVDQSTAKKTFHVRTYDEYWFVNFRRLKTTNFYIRRVFNTSALQYDKLYREIVLFVCICCLRVANGNPAELFVVRLGRKLLNIPSGPNL